MTEDVRNLDEMYYRVERNGKSVNRCFSDLTEEEQDKFMAKYDDHTLNTMYEHLVGDLLYVYAMELSLEEKRTMIKEKAKFLKNIAKKFDIDYKEE